jgi:uncharacterized membrane protein YfcA
MTAILLTLLASLLGSTAQTTVGFGIALFLSPVMFLLLEPAEAVLATLTAATSVSVLMLLGERDRLALNRGVSLGLLVPMVPGVLLGAGLLGIVDKAYLQIAVGLVVLTFVGYQERSRRAGSEPGPQFRFGSSAVPSGFAAGVLNGSVSTGGPPLAIWLRSVGSSPNQMRHTLAVVFIAMNLLTIAAILILDSPEISGEWGRAVAGALVGVPLGYALGRRILGRIDERTFASIVAIGLVAVAAISAISGFSAL